LTISVKFSEESIFLSTDANRFITNSNEKKIKGTLTKEKD